MQISSNESLQNDDATTNDIDVKKIIFHYLSHWKWFIASLVLFIVIGNFYLWRQTPLYYTQASLLIKNDKKNGNVQNMVLEQFDFSTTSTLDNEIEILRSYSLMEKVAADLRLNVSYSYKQNFKRKELYKNSPVIVIPTNNNVYSAPLLIYLLDGNKIDINGTVYPDNTLYVGINGSMHIVVDDSLRKNWNKEIPITVSFTPVTIVAESLRSAIAVRPSSRGSSVLYISILAPIPAKGEDIVNRLIENYNLAAIADKNSLAHKTLEFIDERLDLLYKDVKATELALQSYKSSHNITDISSEAHSFLQMVQENDAQKSQLDIQLSILQNMENYVLQKGNQNGTVPAIFGINEPVLLSLIEKLSKAETERTEALTTMKPANPVVLNLDEKITQLKQSILENIRTLRDNLEITRQKLMIENKRIEGMIQSVPQKERELIDLVRQNESKNELYIYLLSKKEETAISDATTIADSRVIDPARSSRGPVKPIKKNIQLVFLLIGLLVPVGVIFILDQWNDKIKTRSDVEKKIRVPVLGEVSFLPQAVKVLTMNKNNSKHAEQIRSLRTNLEFMRVGGCQTILLTSSISGEGKSFLSANLGAAFAAMGKRTVVLGFDLRRQGLQKIFGVDNDKGLTNYLVGQNTLSEIIIPIGGVENLSIISCGYLAPNPQELLLGALLPKLFEELKKQFDYIIIDTSPIGLVSDARIISQYADASIYVLRSAYTPKDKLKFINDLSLRGDLKNMGVVINGIKEDRWYGYYTSYEMKKYYGDYEAKQDNGK